MIDVEAHTALWRMAKRKNNSGNEDTPSRHTPGVFQAIDSNLWIRVLALHNDAVHSSTELLEWLGRVCMPAWGETSKCDDGKKAMLVAPPQRVTRSACGAAMSASSC